jgi:hypothetical protein
MLSVEAFRESLSQAAPPAGLSLPLHALWYASRGDWDAAHERVQESPDRDGAWVHAHLHRQEGDLGNAAYWYRRAGKPVATATIEEEREALIEALLSSAS